MTGGEATTRGDGRQGLTLVEMLVVLVIIGASAGLAVLSFGAGNTAAAQTEANRLADRLQVAADEALIAGRPVRLRTTPGGYDFDTGDAADPEWAVIYEFPRGVILSGQADIVIDPDGAASPAVVTIRDRVRGWRIAFDGLNAVVTPAPERGAG